MGSGPASYQFHRESHWPFRVSGENKIRAVFPAGAVGNHKPISRYLCTQVMRDALRAVNSPAVFEQAGVECLQVLQIDVTLPCAEVFRVPVADTVLPPTPIETCTDALAPKPCRSKKSKHYSCRHDGMHHIGCSIVLHSWNI
jgi:hypothetical protein